MSESDGKDWPMTTERDAWIKRAAVEALAHYEECETMDHAGLVTMAMERAWNAARSTTECEANEASRVAFIAARRKTLADAVVLRRGVPGGSGWEGARHDADGNAASTVGHADPMVVLAAVLGKEAPRPPEAGAIERAREQARKEERERLRALVCSVPGNEEATVAALSWLNRAIDGKEDCGPNTLHERVHKTRLGWLESGRAFVLTRVEEAAAEYRRRAQATRVEAEVAEAKADALAGAVAAIRREVAP